MPTIRETFHTIANQQNKVTVAAGCTKEILKGKPLQALTKEELKIQQESLIQAFAKIEDNTFAANEKMMELKEFIYKKLNPDTNIDS